MSDTLLNENEYGEAKNAVLVFLKGNDSITNRQFRVLTGFNYDQAIFFFNRMVNEGALERVGKTGGIKYVLKT